MKTIVGLFDDIEDARDVIDDLIDSGFNRSDVSLVARDYEGVYADRLESGSMDVDANDSAAEGAAAGAVGGGVIGGLAGFLVGISALAIPGVGPIVAAGPIVATLTGAGIGAATGGILGALVGWGIPEEEAEYYAEGVRRGGTLVGVKATEAQVNDVIQIMNDHNPVNIERRTAYWRDTGWQGFDPEGNYYSREEFERERELYPSYSGRDRYDTYGSSS